MREKKLYLFGLSVFISFILGIILLFIFPIIGIILISPLLFFILMALTGGRTRRCVKCRTVLPRHSAFIDYCEKCAKKRESKREEKI